jgi:hypothetical protein
VRPREFLERVPSAVRRAVPPGLASFHAGRRFSLVQLWYGNRAIHYEAWLRSNTLEVGLHFEADPLTNARLLAAFRARTAQIQDVLGEQVRIEEWDKGWARVWEPSAHETSDDDALARVASRLAAYICALQPILLDELPADVPWSEPPVRRSARSARGRHRAGAGTRAKQRR